ncbi:MAG: tyrosine-type recombinase/integrase, partial [Eubacteriales bacterium]|nr:tyrosine-type recombinase/integrase [Eubacteriales bacterium]
GKVDIRALQQILGHASVATTEIYTHIDNESLHQAVEANPLNQHRPGRRRSAKSGV